MSEDYIYAVARIRTRELSLLDGQVMESLLAAKDYDECLRLLSDKGWAVAETDSAEALLAAERKKTWDLIGELVPDMSVFDVFLYEKDYHNLKAAIKDALLQNHHPGIFMQGGTVAPEKIVDAVDNHNFKLLPEPMQKPAEEAFSTLLHTRDGQMCDIILDRACLEQIQQAGKKTGSDILSLYGELLCASANIKTAVRACRTGKTRQFLDTAIAKCDSLDRSRLIGAASENIDQIYAYLDNTRYSDAVPALKESLSAFERWCDNLIIRKIRPQIRNPFTIGPLAAYILARENEIKSVRIILSGKLNALDMDAVRERVREMYV